MLQAFRSEPSFGSAMASSLQGLQQLSETVQNPPLEPNAPFLLGNNNLLQARSTLAGSAPNKGSPVNYNLLQARSTLPASVLNKGNYNLLQARSTSTASALNTGSLNSALAELELALAMERRQKQQVLAENNRLLAKDAALMQALTAARASGTSRVTSSAGSVHRNTTAPNASAQTGTFHHGRSVLQAYWSDLEYYIPFFARLPLELKVAVAGMIAASVIALLLSALQSTLGSALWKVGSFFTKRAKGANCWSSETKKSALSICLIYGCAIYVLWEAGCVQPILSSILVYVVLASFVLTLLVIVLREVWNASKDGILFPFNAIIRMHHQFTEIEKKLGILSSEDASNMAKGKHPAVKKGTNGDEDDSDSDDDDDDDEEGEPAGGGNEAASPEAAAKQKRAAEREALARRLGANRRT